MAFKIVETKDPAQAAETLFGAALASLPILDRKKIEDHSVVFLAHWKSTLFHGPAIDMKELILTHLRQWPARKDFVCFLIHTQSTGGFGSNELTAAGVNGCFEDDQGPYATPTLVWRSKDEIFVLIHGVTTR